MPNLLSAEHEALVEDLLFEFSERLQNDANVSLAAFVERCPSDRVRARFLELANVYQLLEVTGPIYLGNRAARAPAGEK